MIDGYKASEEYHDVLVKYGQDSFNEGDGIGFDDCRCLITIRLPKPDLSFLDDDEDDEVATIEPAPPSSGATKERARNKEATIEVSLPSIAGPSKDDDPSEASLGPSGVAPDSSTPQGKVRK